MNDWVAIALLVLLLAGNAFFVSGEFSIMSTRRAQVEPLAEEGNKRAQTVIYALEHVSLMLATCQLGITICSLLILNVSEPALHLSLIHIYVYKRQGCGPGSGLRLSRGYLP